MILLPDEIENYIKNGVPVKNSTEILPLISNLPEDFQIEGCTVDFSIESLYLVDGYDIDLMRDYRNTGNIIPIEEDDNEVFTLKPKEAYIGLTKEIVNIPINLVAIPIQRVTCFTAGLSIETGVIQPNFFGKLKFGIYNRNKTTVRIQKGFRMITVMFKKLFGNANPYDGFHQGGTQISTMGRKAPPR